MNSPEKFEESPIEKKEGEGKRIEWRAAKEGTTAMHFPSGNEYFYSDYSIKFYYYLHEGRELEDLPTFEDAVSLMKCDEHSYQSVQWLEFIKRKYPEKFGEGVKTLKERTKTATTLDLIAHYYGFDMTDEDGFYCDEEGWWYKKLDPEEKDNAGRTIYDKYDPEVINEVTRIFLRYAPPIGSKRRHKEKKFELADYLVNKELQEQFKDEIPHISSSWSEIKKEVLEDPTKALRRVLLNLPAYNAGKVASYIGRAVEKNRDKLNKTELIELVGSNKQIGPFDKKAIISTINKAFEE